MSHPFWDEPETVERFAGRDPDRRLLGLLEAFPNPESTRVLDLGCAGGRNTAWLAEHGFDVWARDASVPMVERTRVPVSRILGREEAERRIRQGRMDDLGDFADASFDLVVALGLYQNAESLEEWRTALDETARVLASGGLLLVAHFTPEVDLTGEGTRPVPDQPGVYEGMPGGRAVLVDAPTLDAAMERRGLRPAERSDTVRVETERGRRVTVNALYRKV